MPRFWHNPARWTRALAGVARAAAVAVPLALFALNLIGLALGEASLALWDNRFPFGRLPHLRVFSNGVFPDLLDLSFITVAIAVAYLCSPRVRQLMRACATRPACAAGTIAGVGLVLFASTVSQGEAHAALGPVVSVCWFTALPLIALILYRAAYQSSARMLFGACSLAAAIILLAFFYPAVASACIALSGLGAFVIRYQAGRAGWRASRGLTKQRSAGTEPWAHPPRLGIAAVMVGVTALVFCLCAGDDSLTALKSWPEWLPLNASTWLKFNVLFMIVVCGLSGSAVLGQCQIAARRLRLLAIGATIGVGACIAAPPVVLPTVFCLTALLPAALSVLYTRTVLPTKQQQAPCEEPIALFPALCVLATKTATFHVATIYDKGATVNAGVRALAIVLVLAIGAATLVRAPSRKSGTPPKRFLPFFDRYDVTEREQQILYSLYQGYSFSEIAQELTIGRSTASTYATRCYRKLGVTSKREALDMMQQVDALPTHHKNACATWLVQRCTAIAALMARSRTTSSVWMGCLLFSTGSTLALRLRALVLASTITVDTTTPLLLGAALMTFVLYRTRGGSTQEPAPAIACLVSLLALLATVVLAFPPATPRPAWVTALFDQLAAYAIIPMMAQCVLSASLIASRALPIHLGAVGAVACGLCALSYAIPHMGAALMVGSNALFGLGVMCLILGAPIRACRAHDIRSEIYRMRPLQIIGFALMGAALSAAATRLSPTDLIAPAAALLPPIFAALLTASSTLTLLLARRTNASSILPMLPPCACLLVGACCAGGIPTLAGAAVPPYIATGALLLVGLTLAWNYPRDVCARYAIFALPDHLLRARLAHQAHLTDTEQTIAIELARGVRVNTLASELVVSPHTIRTHRKHIYQKLGAHSYQEFLGAFLSAANKRRRS